MKKNLLFVLLFLITSSISLAGTPSRLYSDDEVDVLKTRLTSKLENNLSNYLGEIKFSVFLKLDPQLVNPKQKSSELVSLYMLDNQTIKNEAVLQNKLIESASVKVVVFEKLDKPLDKELSDLVESTLDPIKPKVEISYRDSTRSLLDKNPIKNEKKEEESLLKTLLSKHLADLIKLFGVVVFALSAILGIVIFGSFFKAPINAIADSLKSSSEKTTNTTTEEESDEKLVSLPVIDHEEASNKFKENLAMFKDILIEKPVLISNYIMKEDINAAGVKKLLPYIYEKQCNDVIKENFEEMHFTKMAQSTSTFASYGEFVLWFGKTVESLSLQVLNKPKNVLAGIPEIQLEIVKKIPLALFKKYLHENSNSLAYQIIMDLLKGEDKVNFLKMLDINEWKMAFAVKDISEEEINAEIERIITFSKSSMVDDDIVTANQIQSSLIIPSLLSVLTYKKLKDQDEFIDSLSSISENSIKLIKESYWSPADLYQVPANFLQDQIRSYSAQDKCMIIYSMPSEVGQFLIENALDGKVREIVKDNLKNISSDFNEEKAEQLGVAFIADLLKAYKSNLFALVNIDHSNVVNFDDKKSAA